MSSLNHNFWIYSKFRKAPFSIGIICLLLLIKIGLYPRFDKPANRLYCSTNKVTGCNDTMNCEKCGIEIPNGEEATHSGTTLCEDCYIDALAAPKVCDPWAVYTAKKEMGENPELTVLQNQMLAFLTKEGPVTDRRVCEALNISLQEFKINFTTLRHMELTRATKKGDQVLYTLFDK